MVTGSTLQEDIVATARQLLLRGRNILGLVQPANQSRPTYDQQTSAAADRLRQIPPSFSWVDHRLVRHESSGPCDHSAWALYLFLVTVADVQGLSYYSDADALPTPEPGLG